jgi:hypothetical protein
MLWKKLAFVLVYLVAVHLGVGLVSWHNIVNRGQGDIKFGTNSGWEFAFVVDLVMFLPISLVTIVLVVFQRYSGRLVMLLLCTSLVLVIGSIEITYVVHVGEYYVAKVYFVSVVVLVLISLVVRLSTGSRRVDTSVLKEFD